MKEKEYNPRSQKATFQTFNTYGKSVTGPRTPTFILVNQLCKKYNLSKEIEDKIMEIAKQAYIGGSNDNYDSLKKYLK